MNLLMISALFATLLFALIACTEPVPTQTPVPEPTATHAPEPTATSMPTPKPESTIVPTPTSTPKPTVTPRSTSTPKPTATPMPEVSPARYCEWFFDEVRIAQWKNDDERAINAGDRVAHALGTNPDTLWDYCEGVPTVDQILAYTGASARNCYHGYNTVICLIVEAIKQVRVAEDEMDGEYSGGHATSPVKCFLIAIGEFEGPQSRICYLNHPELKRFVNNFGNSYYFDRFHEEPHAEFYDDRLDDVADELLNFLNFLDELPHWDLSALSERDKELLQSVIDRVYSEWEKFKAAHEQMVCQYIVCE